MIVIKWLQFRIAVLLAIAGLARASWLSDITGIDINIPRGTVTLGIPNPAAIPQMLQNLPRDAAMFFLNPVGSALALAIRHAKEQGRYGCQSMPPEVFADMQRFYPAPMLQGVCWNVYDPSRITIDNLLIGELHQASAVTFEDVIVFQDVNTAHNSVIWGHELLHVSQYRQLGVEAFANLYTFNARAMEDEAYRMQNFVQTVLANEPTPQQHFQVNNGFGVPLSAQIYSQYARQALPPVQFCGASHLQVDQFGRPSTIAPNTCPIAIRIVSVRTQDLVTGQQFDVPCLSPRCIVGPGAYSVFEDKDGRLRPLKFAVAWAQDLPLQ